MSNDESTLIGQSDILGFDQDNSMELATGKIQTEMESVPFFMDIEDQLADDPSNYCLPEGDRFPDS